MNRLRRAITAATATLGEAGIDSAANDAELLAAHVAGLDRGRLGLAEDPGAEFDARYAQAVLRRARRIPLQHITGTAAFGPVEVRVGPGVFIPRPETEAMLEWACAQQLPACPVIIDVCTGSGALALALSEHRPQARVVAVDDDSDALRYAADNLSSTRVELVRADVTEADLLAELSGAVDLVVANPPYIPSGGDLGGSEVTLENTMEDEVALHDPPHALFGGPDGMAVIAPICRHAARWLRPGGLLAVEHDDSTAGQTVDLVTETGVFGEITAHRDLTGRPRFVTARKTGVSAEGRAVR